MPNDTSDAAHGGFGIEFNPEYTLFRPTGTWNLKCAQVLEDFLGTHSTTKEASRRSMIFDGRYWGFQTRDAEMLAKDIMTRLSNFYSAMYVAYILREDSAVFSSYVVKRITQDVNPTFRWEYFTSLVPAIDWLRSQGFSLPDLIDDDMPESIPAQVYLDDLNT